MDRRPPVGSVLRLIVVPRARATIVYHAANFPKNGTVVRVVVQLRKCELHGIIINIAAPPAAQKREASVSQTLLLTTTTARTTKETRATY